MSSKHEVKYRKNHKRLRQYGVAEFTHGFKHRVYVERSETVPSEQSSLHVWAVGKSCNTDESNGTTKTDDCPSGDELHSAPSLASRDAVEPSESGSNNIFPSSSTDGDGYLPAYSTNPLTTGFGISGQDFPQFQGVPPPCPLIPDTISYSPQGTWSQDLYDNDSAVRPANCAVRARQHSRRGRSQLSSPYYSQSHPAPSQRLYNDYCSDPSSDHGSRSMVRQGAAHPFDLGGTQSDYSSSALYSQAESQPMAHNFSPNVPQFGGQDLSFYFLPTVPISFIQDHDSWIPNQFDCDPRYFNQMAQNMPLMTTSQFGDELKQTTPMPDSLCQGRVLEVEHNYEAIYHGLLSTYEHYDLRLPNLYPPPFAGAALGPTASSSYLPVSTPLGAFHHDGFHIDNEPTDTYPQHMNGHCFE